MRFLVALGLVLAGGCQRHDGGEGRPSAEQIANLSTPKIETPDPASTVRLQPLKVADLDGVSLRPGCQFGRDGHMYLAGAGSDAIARIEGRPLHLIQSSPAGETGGFFEDRQISISVARDEAAAGAGAVGTWPARLIATNRRNRAQARLDGVWRCGR